MKKDHVRLQSSVTGSFDTYGPSEQSTVSCVLAPATGIGCFPDKLPAHYKLSPDIYIASWRCMKFEVPLTREETIALRTLTESISKRILSECYPEETP